MADQNKRPVFVFLDDSPERTTLWPCVIPVPVDGGGISEQEVTARFVVLPGEEHDRVVREAFAAGGDANMAVLKRVLKGFDGLKNAGGTSVPDETAIPVMLSKPYAVLGLVRGYMEMRDGRIAKNFVTPSTSS